jgi:hypothetical protein
MAEAGTILEVDGRDCRWAVFHACRSPGQRGCILAGQTEPVAEASTSTATSEAQAPRSAAPPRQPPATWFAYGGASLAATSDPFVAVTSVPKYLEEEIRTTTYGMPRRPGFEFGGGTWITSRISVGALLTHRQFSQPVDISAQIPHPLYFNQPRTLTGHSTANRAETAIHAQVGASAFSGRHLQVVVAGGPSFSWVQQDLLDQLSYTDTYPFDTVTFTGSTMSTESAHGFGGNVEVTGLVPLSRGAAVQVSGRYVFANVSFAAAGVPDVKGEGQLGIGIRFRF